MQKIALFGIGEAGHLIGKDLADAITTSKKDIKLSGYDPADVKTPAGITRTSTAAEAVTDAHFILSFTGSVDSLTAMNQAIDSIPSSAIYADFSSGSAGLKRELAATANSAGFKFCDVALMAMVPGNGINTPAMFAGDGAQELNALLDDFGMPIDIVSAQAGDAAERKLLRSVVIKGLAGLLIEALEGAHEANIQDWLWKNLVDEFTAMDHRMLQRLVQGTEVHAERRYHEMIASRQQLTELGVEPLMTTGTVANLDRVKQHGVPDVPQLKPVG
jgi:3-hydroxyisobutyrate dehydrogenase-like beta-hydroxyacid dehydrogenase